jgi:hypothetical protein
VRVPVLTVAMLIAACEESPGLQLEVGVTDTSVTRVELIVGAPCDGCPTMMAAPNVKLRETSIYSSPHPDAWFADVDSAFVGFLLNVDGDADQRIPALGIVGYNSANEAIAYVKMQDLVVPANEERYWRVNLKPIVAIDGSVPTDDRERVAVWRHPDQREPSCMMIEHWSSGVLTTSAIVPPTDSDCDHVLVGECSPYVPNAMNVRSTIDDADCFISVALDSSVSDVCMLGGPTCTDGAPPGMTCDRLDIDYCTSESLCTCAPREFGCLLDKVLNGTADGSVTAIRCSVPVNTAGQLCATGTKVGIDISGSFASGALCKSLSMLDSFVGGSSTPDQFGIGMNAKLVLSNFHTPCAIEATLTGDPATSKVDQVSVAFTDVLLDNGRHLALPWRVDAVPNCGGGFTCQFVTSSDSMFACTKPVP